MGAQIKRWLNKPLFIWLYGLAFIVFKASVYFASFRLLPALTCFLIYCAVSSLLFIIFKNISNYVYAGIPVIIVWISILHVVGIATLFGYPYSYIPSSFYIYFYLFVVLLVLVFCYYSKNFSWEFALLFNQLANCFLVIITVVFLINGSRLASKNRMEEKEHLHTQVNTLPEKNIDILWILMDEYGSSSCLSKEFSFHNPIDSVLQQKHFVLLPSIHSRFPLTLFSVNSIFNMDDSLPPSSFFQATDLLRNGSLIPAMERSGYRFVNLGFFDMAQHPMIADRSGYPYQYAQQLTSGTLFYMLYSKWKNTIAKCDSYSRKVFQKLNDTLPLLSKQPRFIWAHIPVPHEPFCRNKEGKLQEDTTYNGNDSVFIKRKYIEYVQYGNKMLLDLLDKHPDLTTKIIIITGDHGPRFPFLKDPDYKKQTFAAVFIPKQFDTVQLQKLAYISQLPGFLLKNILH